jgi:hypothetical protein
MNIMFSLAEESQQQQQQMLSTNTKRSKIVNYFLLFPCFPASQWDS